MGKVNDAIEATKEGRLSALIKERAKPASPPSSTTSVADAMQATTDGTILDFIRQAANERDAVRPLITPLSVQRGRDLFNQIHKEGK